MCVCVCVCDQKFQMTKNSYVIWTVSNHTVKNRYFSYLQYTYIEQKIKQESKNEMPLLSIIISILARDNDYNRLSKLIEIHEQQTLRSWLLVMACSRFKMVQIQATGALRGRCKGSISELPTKPTTTLWLMCMSNCCTAATNIQFLWW